MLNLSRAWSGVLTKATPLPDVWKGLAAEGIKFRRGQVCMIAAAPNAGKSMFALIYAVKAKVPTLFFSADRLSPAPPGWQQQSQQVPPAPT